jgi:hypothetical protein
MDRLDKLFRVIASLYPEKLTQEQIDHLFDIGKRIKNSQAGVEEFYGELTLEIHKDLLKKQEEEISELKRKIRQLKIHLDKSHDDNQMLLKVITIRLDNADTKMLMDKFAGEIHYLNLLLKDYEIIEEDISDLSKYKEETESLKREIQSLKAQLLLKK